MDKRIITIIIAAIALLIIAIGGYLLVNANRAEDASSGQVSSIQADNDPGNIEDNSDEPSSEDNIENGQSGNEMAKVDIKKEPLLPGLMRIPYVIRPQLPVFLILGFSAKANLSAIRLTL